MTLLTWDKSYETGDPVIDLQHRDLLSLVAELSEAGVDQADERSILRLLDLTMDFTFSHFEMEEGLMIRADYPPEDRAVMIQQHAEFKSYARIRVLEFRFGGVEDVQDFAPFLRNWLVDHEFGLDRKLASFMRRTGQTTSAHPDK